MNFLIAAIFIFFSFQCSMCQKCPIIYQRYSKEHSSCSTAKCKYPIYYSGVSKDHEREILDRHNKLRSMVATGKEKSAGGLPQAADMMQMVWDNELAAVAQSYIEQCIYKHDCANCRRVKNFSVGQNIAYREKMCPGSAKCPIDYVSKWADVLQDLYDEVAKFDKKHVKSFGSDTGVKIGHFTQIIWSNTWRVGCGSVAYTEGNSNKQLYICNYGPGGNVNGQPMYKTGPPCSSCPTNSCCGKSCARADYDGLCRMNNTNTVPAYPKEKKYIFYCDFKDTTGDCSVSSTKRHRWKHVKALGGYFAEIVLNGDETSTLMIKNPIRPKENSCFMVKYRSGPNVDGQTSSSSAVVQYKMPNSKPVTMNLPKDKNNQQFFEYNMDLAWHDDTNVSFTFKVPKGAPAQFFNIQLLTAKKGKCDT